uniref:Uncharacterized protein n=1 Tax=Tetraselmis sp. GSL018 TaxID=582737 RepID=A0A061R501_9CHLO
MTAVTYVLPVFSRFCKELGLNSKLLKFAVLPWGISVLMRLCNCSDPPTFGGPYYALSVTT